VSVPEIERQIGIETYLTGTEGIGGAIRRAAEDFVVEEVLVDGAQATAQNTTGKAALGATETRQRFLLCVLVKRNWDTFIALRNLAKELNIEPKQIQIAGIKDAKAVTAQHITLEGVSAEAAANVEMRDVILRPVGYVREALCPFYLLGNHFKITINDVSAPDPAAQVEQAYGEVSAAGGIPNYYGHQRFGTTRAITHLVGKAMVQGNLQEAAMAFLAKPTQYEHPNSRQMRAQLGETMDFKQALQDFPTQLRFERVMLKHLAENPSDFAGAFRWLPLKLRMLFVQAWQSYLFNRFLSARIKAGFSLGKAEVGDFVVGVERNGLPIVKANKIVDSTNVEAINGQITAGRMRVALPVVGTRQKLSTGTMGELEQAVLEQEGVQTSGFWVPELTELSAKGELRAVGCPVKNFAAHASNDKMTQEFTLLRSAYATVLLREIMKPKDLVAAGF